MAARTTAALLGIELSEQQLQRGTPAFHNGLAISWASLYQVLRRKTQLGPVLAGLATGAAMSVVADEIMARTLGFAAPNRAYPLVTTYEASPPIWCSGSPAPLRQRGPSEENDSRHSGLRDRALRAHA